MAMTNTKVANSDGWSWSGPNENHRADPSAGDPMGDRTASRANSVPT